MSFTYDANPAKDEDEDADALRRFVLIELISYVFFSALIHLNFFVRGAFHVI